MRRHLKVDPAGPRPAYVCAFLTRLRCRGCSPFTGVVVYDYSTFCVVLDSCNGKSLREKCVVSVGVCVFSLFPNVFVLSRRSACLSSSFPVSVCFSVCVGCRNLDFSRWAHQRKYIFNF